MEVHNLGPGTGSILGNMATSQDFVQTGDNVMIGGFIIEGTEPKTVIVRAIRYQAHPIWGHQRIG